MGLAYRDAGVDIDAGNRTVQLIKGYARSTFRPEVVTDIGLFGGMFALGSYSNPVLVSSADGVGTKIKIAIAMDKHDTIGIDLVNHCVNDILTCGAEALFFLDYFATGKLIPEQAADVVKGLGEACRGANCALLGGETAEMPGMYAEGEYDLAGFIVGVVERDTVLDGRNIQAGDAILGLPSSGLHTNGFSLVRRCFELSDTDVKQARGMLEKHYPELDGTLGEVLLSPHRCYGPLLQPLLKGKMGIKGMAHITGGGLVENVPRVLPAGLAARIQSQSWPVLPIFNLIARVGDVEPMEMYRVFNMGIGIVLIVDAEKADNLRRELPEAMLIGEVVSGQDDIKVIIDD